MLRKILNYGLLIPAVLFNVATAAPFASDPTVPHHDGFSGKLDGIYSWMLVDAPNGTKSTHCNYAIGQAPNGDIYISGQDYSTNSTLFRLDNTTDKLWFVGDARTASQEANNWLPGETCEKFHCRPTYVNGKVYVASADYSNEDAGYLNQRGFHWYSYDEKANTFKDLSVADSTGISGRPSIMSIVADPKRGVIYGIGQPVPELFSYSIATGKTTNLGKPPFAPEGFYTCARYLWLDKDGRVYFTIKPFNYICYYDPNTNTFGQRTDWPTLNKFSTNIRNGVFTIDGKYHYLADYEGHIFKFSVNDITWEYVGHATTEDTTHYKTFLNAKKDSILGRDFRIRSMSLSPDGKKIYFLNDEATSYSLFEYDIATDKTIRLCYRTDIDNTYTNINYNDHAGHNAWDLKGRFYFSSFGYQMPQKVQVIMTRVDPVRLKVDLGLLPGLTEINIFSVGPHVMLRKSGFINSAQEVLLCVEEMINGQMVKNYKTVVIPKYTPLKVIQLKDLSVANKSKVKITVISNGNTYIAGCHDVINSHNCK